MPYFFFGGITYKAILHSVGVFITCRTAIKKFNRTFRLIIAEKITPFGQKK